MVTQCIGSEREFEIAKMVVTKDGSRYDQDNHQVYNGMPPPVGDCLSVVPDAVPDQQSQDGQ